MKHNFSVPSSSSIFSSFSLPSVALLLFLVSTTSARPFPQPSSSLFEHTASMMAQQRHHSNVIAPSLFIGGGGGMSIGYGKVAIFDDAEEMMPNTGSGESGGEEERELLEKRTAPSAAGEEGNQPGKEQPAAVTGEKERQRGNGETMPPTGRSHAQLFSRMRNICARMNRLKRKRAPQPGLGGSPESLVAFLCSNTNLF